MDADKYPFVVFADTNKDGTKECVGGFSAWSDSSVSSSNPVGALICAKDNAWRPGGAVIYMRRDYDIITGGYNNLCHINGSVLVDLGGHTLTGGKNELFGATSKRNNNTTISVKNGNFLLESNSLISFGVLDNGNGSKFIIDFENMNIGFAPGATVKAITKTYTPSSVSESTVAGCDLTFTDCNFDFKTNAPVGKITFIGANGDNGHHSVNVSVKGGSFVGSNADNLIFKDFDNHTNANAPDSFRFIKDDNGSFAVLKLSSGSQCPEETFEGLGFTLLSDDGVISQYTLCYMYLINGYDADSKTATVTVENKSKLFH